MTDESSLRKQVEDFNNLIIKEVCVYSKYNVWIYCRKTPNEKLKFQPYVYTDTNLINFFKMFEPVFKRRGLKCWRDFGILGLESNGVYENIYTDVDVDVVRTEIEKYEINLMNAIKKHPTTIESFSDDYYTSVFLNNIDFSIMRKNILVPNVKTIKKFKIEMEDMIKNFEISFKHPSILDIHHYILRGYKTENSYILRANRMDVKNVFFQIKEKKIESPLRLHTVRDGIQLFDIWELQKLNSFYNEPIKTEQDLLSLKMEFLDSYFDGFQHCSNSKVYIEPDTV